MNDSKDIIRINNQKCNSESNLLEVLKAFLNKKFLLTINVWLVLDVLDMLHWCIK